VFLTVITVSFPPIISFLEVLMPLLFTEQRRKPIKKTRSNLPDSSKFIRMKIFPSFIRLQIRKSTVADYWLNTVSSSRTKPVALNVCMPFSFIPVLPLLLKKILLEENAERPLLISFPGS
jgi:hypothetical protein